MTRDEAAAFLLAFGAKVNETVDLPLEERGRIIQAMMDECTDEQKLLVVRIFQAAGVVPTVRQSRLRATMDPADYAAVCLLGLLSDQLPPRSLERDILVCAELYLEGEREPGGTVARWWNQQDKPGTAQKSKHRHRGPK